MIDILRLAAAKVGSVTGLAKELGIEHPSMYKWRRVPAHHAAAISRITKVPLYKIRPDVFAFTERKTFAKTLENQEQKSE